MEFETWRTWSGPGLREPQSWEYPLLLLYAALMLALAVLHRRSFRGWRRGLLLLALLVSPLVVTRLLVLTPAATSNGGRPDLYTAGLPPSVRLLGALPVAIAAWLGPGPALITGWASGVVQAAWTTGGLTDSFHLALSGFLLALLLRQEYRGRVAGLLRQPLAACPLAALATAPLLFLSVFVRLAVRPLAGTGDALAWTIASLPSLLIESLVAGLLTQAAIALFPSLRLARLPSTTPPYSRTPRRRALFTLLPVLLTLTGASLCIVTGQVTAVEKSRAVARMAEDANAAALAFAYFVDEGEGLLAQFARDDALLADSQGELEEQLGRYHGAVAFFDRLALFTDSGVPIAEYPQGATPVQLTEVEHELLQLVLDTGAVHNTSAHQSSEDGVVFSFLVAARGSGEGERQRALLGRARVVVNPLLRAVLSSIQGADGGREGFAVDDDGRIILHPDAGSLLQDWQPAHAAVRLETDSIGEAFDGRSAADNTRSLSYYLPVEGHPWAIVIVLPFEVILAQAARVGLPFLLLQIVISGAITVAAAFFPQLTSALGSWGNEDARAGGGRSRRSQPSGSTPMTSKDLQNALAVVAEVGHRIGSAADPGDALPLVLEAAVTASGSAVARLVFPSREGTPQTVIGRGESVDGVALIDSALGAAATEPDKPVVIEDLSQQTTLVGGRASQGGIRALVALPIRTASSPSMVMWIGYTAVRSFSDMEVSLLRALAGQITTLFESSRRLHAAEAEGLRLTAVLDQSPDGVVVANPGGQVLYVNPPAAQALAVSVDEAVGRDLEDIGLPAPVLDLVQDGQPQSELPTQEISLPDGGTWHLTASLVAGPEGQPIGRAIRMRDVTESRQMDEDRAQLVGKLSHDLRTPLSLIRGYGAMFPTEGALNERQSLFLDKMMMGARQIEQMLDQLTELEAADSGAPLDLRPCHLGTILSQAADSYRARVAAKGLSLRLEVPEESGTVAGDADLLRQVVNHLLDNSVKYTPGGGMVTIGLEVREDDAEISVADTGTGFPPEELARVLDIFSGTGGRRIVGKNRLGVGLSTVLSIVERHGGTVSIDSEPNKGSTVSFTLPLIRKRARPAR